MSRTGQKLASRALMGLLAAATPAVATPSVAVIEIEGTPAARSAGMSWLGEEASTLRDYVETFDTVAYDDEFDGLVIRLKDSALGITQVEELGAAMLRVRDAGKKVHVFAEGYGPGEVMLGSFADEVIVQSGGMVSLPGMHMEEMFLADTLSWLGVEAQLVQVGDYKGANEQMTRSGPSDAWDQNIESLLDGLYESQRMIVGEGRGLDTDALDQAMAVAWWADADDAINAGLIDAAVDLPEIRDHLASTYGDKPRWVKNPYTIESTLDTSNPFALMTEIFGAGAAKNVIEGPSIAVLHISGTIIDGDSSSGGLLGGGNSVGSRTIRNTIEEILREDDIKGVIVRVDSPGGSAIASEVMWQGIQRLKEEKPVWVSVGSMAASGGYYVLSAGDKVYVNPSSIVGSIGVVGGKYAMGDLYDKLKINVVERSRGPAAMLNSTARPWTESEQDLIRQKMTETYELFTDRVAAGRPGIDLSKTAEGRLFVGRDAVGLNMADEVGGLDDAIADMAAHIGLSTPDIVEYPLPPTFEEMLEQMLGGFVQAPALAQRQGELVEALRMLLGEQRFAAVRDSLAAFTLLRDENVLLVSPRAIIIR
ncbi:MAG: signal peptide peptidase SppA [Phycisphaerales bacterium]